MCFSFQAIGTLVHFYHMPLQHESAYVFMDIATLRIPTQRADVRNILQEIDAITQPAHFHDTLCKPIQNTILHSPTVSYELFDFKTKQSKPTKHDRDQGGNQVLILLLPLILSIKHTFNDYQSIRLNLF